MRAFTIAVVLATLALLGRPAQATTCIVDLGGLGIPNAFPTTNAALAACTLPGSVVEVRCPAAGCTDTNVVVSGLTGITIRSSELDGLGGPAVFLGVNNQPALTVFGGADITIAGISSFSAQQIAVWISNSDADFTAPAGRYTTFSGPSIGLLVDGTSNVVLAQAGFNNSTTGITMTSTPAGAPYVKVTGGAFLHNRLAASIAGPAVGCNGATKATLEIRGDTTAWLSYVMDNNEGFRLTGRAALLLDHGVLANNLDMPGPFPNAYLFNLSDASYIEVRNALIYDNDAFPGLTGPYPGGGLNTASIIYNSRSCARSSFIASTIVNNAADLVFNLGGNGLLTLDHVAISGNWAKVLSMSGYYVNHGNTCPPAASLTVIGTTVWNNKADADPIQCLPAALITWDPMAVPNNPPRTLANYPTLDPPPTSIYLINRLQPLTVAPPPAGLYTGRPWSVDGIHGDTDLALDVGYHNPQ